MRFYNQQRHYDCGVDLHSRSMYLCIRNHSDTVVLNAPERGQIALHVQ
jgi:hypothetical protein